MLHAELNAHKREKHRKGPHLEQKAVAQGVCARALVHI